MITVNGWCAGGKGGGGEGHVRFHPFKRYATTNHPPNEFSPCFFFVTAVERVVELSVNIRRLVTYPVLSLEITSTFHCVTHLRNKRKVKKHAIFYMNEHIFKIWSFFLQKSNASFIVYIMFLF